MKFLKIILIVNLSILFFSCENNNFFLDNIISVNSPFQGKCVFIDKGGNLISENVYENQKIKIVKQDSFTPVIFIPHIHYNESYLNLSQGILYPINIKPDISGGIMGQAFLRLIFQSQNDKKIAFDYCNHFNWKKLYDELKTYEDDSSNNLENNLIYIDMDILVSHIANNCFSKYSIKFKS